MYWWLDMIYGQKDVYYIHYIVNTDIYINVCTYMQKSNVKKRD